MMRRTLAAVLTGLLSLAGLAACGAGSRSEANTLHVLAGSEVKDMEPILADMEKETGVHLEFEYMGTLDGTEALLAAQDGGAWDATWFPSNRYLSLFPEASGLVDRSTSIMRSPVVLGLLPEAADRLGWTEAAPPTWQEVVDAVGAGELAYGMTSPVASNSGFTTLVEAATALSGTGSVLQEADIATATPALETFAGGQHMAAGSSGWLADEFARQPGNIDGIFNYESVLRGLTVDGEKLVIVIPSAGVVTADYPLSLLTGASPEEAANFDAVVEYLMRDDVQQRIAEATLRRTTATPPSMDATVFELPFPATLGTVQQLLGAWVSSIKKPSNMVFAIDTSGSMDEDRMVELQDALGVLSGQQGGESSHFLTLQPRERITLLEFATDVKSTETVEIPLDPAGYDAALQELDQIFNEYWANGYTAIYETLQAALETALRDSSGEMISSVVLFTDGESNRGATPSEFENWYAQWVAENPEAQSIPVYVIVFGEANFDELSGIAGLTGGRAFDAKGDLTAVFREIRGYL